jgi:DNA-binding PadR family transcriptional regulator
MIEHKMLFLGLLVDGPKHAYEIKRIISEELYPLMGLTVKSIYYPLKKMERLGLVTKDVGREGRWPEKYIYSITPEGKRIFNHLAAESFLSIDRPFFNINLSLYFLQYVDKKIAKRKLRGRLMFLKRIKASLEELIKKQLPSSSPHFPIILEHDLHLVEAEISSFTKLTKTLED